MTFERCHDERIQDGGSQLDVLEISNLILILF